MHQSINRSNTYTNYVVIATVLGVAGYIYHDICCNYAVPVIVLGVA